MSIFGQFQERKLQLRFVPGAKLHPLGSTASLRLISKFKPHGRNDSFPPYIRSFSFIYTGRTQFIEMLVQEQRRKKKDENTKIERNYQLHVSSVCSVFYSVAVTWALRMWLSSRLSAHWCRCFLFQTIFQLQEGCGFLIINSSSVPTGVMQTSTLHLTFLTDLSSTWQLYIALCIL